MALDTRYSVQTRACCRRARTSASTRCSKRLGFHLWHPALEMRDGERAAADPRGLRGIPRAPRRRAHDHAAARHRSRRGGAPRWTRDEIRARHGLAAAHGRPASEARAAVTSPTAPTSTPARPGPRSAPTSSATCPQVKRRVCPDAPFGLGLRLSGARPATLGAARRAGGVRGLPAPRVALRLHDQRLSLRPLPRHAGEGRRVPAGLARRGAARLHEPAGRPAGAAAAGRCRRGRQHQHGAGRLPIRGGHARRTWSASPSSWCATRRTSSTSSVAPGGASRSRSSRSPAACSRPSTRPSRSSASTCIRRGGSAPRRTHRPRCGRRGQGAARSPRRVPRPVPRGGRVRGARAVPAASSRPPASRSPRCRSAPGCASRG